MKNINMIRNLTGVAFSLILIFLTSCSGVRLSLYYSPDNFRFAKVLIVTYDTPETHNLNTLIADQVKLRLQKKKIEALVILSSRKDTFELSPAYASAVATFGPDCVLTMLPSTQVPYASGIITVNYNIVFYHNGDSKEINAYFSGGLLINYTENKQDAIAEKVSKGLFRSVFEKRIQTYGCGC